MKQKTGGWPPKKLESSNPAPQQGSSAAGDGGGSKPTPGQAQRGPADSSSPKPKRKTKERTPEQKAAVAQNSRETIALNRAAKEAAARQAASQRIDNAASECSISSANSSSQLQLQNSATQRNSQDVEGAAAQLPTIPTLRPLLHLRRNCQRKTEPAAHAAVLAKARAEQLAKAARMKADDEVKIRREYEDHKKFEKNAEGVRQCTLLFQSCHADDENDEESDREEIEAWTVARGYAFDENGRGGRGASFVSTQRPKPVIAFRAPRPATATEQLWPQRYRWHGLSLAA